MTNRRNGLLSSLVVGFSVGIIVTAVQPAAAQSTIFNIPSTDTVSPKKGYFEFDDLTQAPGPGGGRFQIFVPRVVVGVTPQLEVGVNEANTHYSGSGSATFSYVQPNAKYKFFANDDKGLAAAAGIVGYLPINHRSGSDSYAMVYGNFSKKVKSGTHGPRVTFGPYGIVGASDAFYGPKGGVLLGYEQPMTGTVAFVADWFSGKNGFGYFTPGVSLTLPHSGLLNIGYSFGNDSFADPSNDNHALFLYYGITFP